MERFRLFNLQEKNTCPIFAGVTETQTLFHRKSGTSNSGNYETVMKKFMKKNSLFNLQEKNAHPIFADVTETQTPFLPNGRHEKIAAEVFLAFIDNTNFILLIKTRF